MANFCRYCGLRLDETTGLCPTCDKEKIEALARKEAVQQKDTFCAWCGTVTDKQTGNCTNPNCEKGPKGPVKKAASQTAAEKKPKKKRSPAGRAVITVLLSICLFVTAFAALFIFDVRSALDDDNAEKLLDNIQLEDLMDTAQVAKDSDVQRLYDKLDETYGIEMTDRKLNSFINRSTVKEYLAEKVADFGEDFFEGDAVLSLSKSEAIELLTGNADVIRDVFDVSLSTAQIQKIVSWMFVSEEVVLLDTMNMEEEIPLLYYLVKAGFSYGMMAFLILLSLLVIFFMIRNGWSQAACGVGIDFVILGGLTGCVAMLAAWIPPLWKTICADSLVGTVVGNVLSIGAVASIALLVIGIVLLVIRKAAARRSAPTPVQ